MNEKIAVELTYTPDDYARGLKYIQNRQFLVKYLPFIVIGAFLLTWVFEFSKNPAQFVTNFFTPYGSLFILIPLMVLSFLFFYKRNKPSFFLKQQVKRQFKSSPALQEAKILWFDDEGISGSSSLGDALTKWAAFVEATETKDDFFFFTSSKFAQFVPKRCFKSEEDQERLRNLVKRHLGDKAKL